jgi:hypothetical protein
VSPPEQLSAPRTSYIGVTKAKLKKNKKNTGQCKSEGKDFKRHNAKEKLRENMGQCKSKERDFKE